MKLIKRYVKAGRGDEVGEALRERHGEVIEPDTPLSLETPPVHRGVLGKDSNFKLVNINR